jgi:hypothetical protein
MRRIRLYLHWRRSRKYWKQFESEGPTVYDHLEFAKDNLTNGNPQPLGYF